MYDIYQKYRTHIHFIAKLIIISGAFYIIATRLSSSDHLYYSIDNFDLQNNLLITILSLLTILLFTVSNWFLEILKWKNLVASFKNIHFFSAFKQSTASLTASLLTPNRIGEYGAKALYYPKNDQKKILALNFIGNTSQMLITVLFGLAGIYNLREMISLHLQLPKIFWLFGGFAILALTISQLGFFKEWIKKFKKYFQEIPLRIQVKNLIFSVFRYLIFSHQFYFLLILFQADLDYFTAMNLIFSMYLIASLIPGFVAFDFIIKGSVAVTLFSYFQVSEVIVLSITTIMWLLNFALPAVIGSYFVLTFKSMVPQKIQVLQK